MLQLAGHLKQRLHRYGTAVQVAVGGETLVQIRQIRVHPVSCRQVEDSLHGVAVERDAAPLLYLEVSDYDVLECEAVATVVDGITPEQLDVVVKRVVVQAHRSGTGGRYLVAGGRIHYHVHLQRRCEGN